MYHLDLLWDFAALSPNKGKEFAFGTNINLQSSVPCAFLPRFHPTSHRCSQEPLVLHGDVATD